MNKKVKNKKKPQTFSKLFKKLNPQSAAQEIESPIIKVKKKLLNNISIFYVFYQMSKDNFLKRSLIF